MLDYKKKLNESKQQKYQLAKMMIKKIESLHDRELYEASLVQREISVPQIWDLGNNNVATTSFFSDIVDAIFSSDLSGVKLVINLDELTEFSIETIVYFIAIVNLLNHNKIRFSGLLPNDENMKRKLGHYGFHHHVEMTKNLKYDKSVLAVEYFNRTKPELVNKIRTFTKINCRLIEGTYMTSLCEMIIEMMDNTCNHAYDSIEETRNILNRWYLCAKNETDYISYVFLDTGLGIPNTVMRKWNEFSSYSNSKIIFSALIGDYPRSSTGNKFRGKGLLQIYDHFLNENCIHDFKVISGRGMCVFSNSEKKNAELIELSSDIKGTIFSWRIEKDEVLKGYGNYENSN